MNSELPRFNASRRRNSEKKAEDMEDELDAVIVGLRAELVRHVCLYDHAIVSFI